MRETHIANEIGIISETYQNRALQCVSQFLSAFRASAKTQSKKLLGDKSIPVTLRVHEKPPSVQILQLPKGGPAAGELRICEKLFPGVIADDIVIAHAEDLTRECIIMTFNDATIEKILKSGLISTQQIAQTLDKIRRGHPNFFIVVQRYIMGIERKSGLVVPYSIVEESDEKTFHYLEKLPEILV